eukprot:TRINITY_DN95648_c0_g1_i1.p2 TRINITY_DN95648_c0_g1~~TRINITY_DN95648_c0_g1_i1.p2  ORF type:complete len:114 (-),score=6.91 TRINITY_DN95648_c0_g1_i1:479-820(-)
MPKATISFNSDASGTLSYNGKRVSCGGKKGFDYDKDVTVSSSNCYENKRSLEFNVDMKWAVGPVQWRRGAYIHSWPYLLPTSGCIHLYDSDAKNFHDYVKNSGPVRIVISYPW